MTAFYDKLETITKQVGIGFVTLMPSSGMGDVQ
jgi:hypothetical protein